MNGQIKGYNFGNWNWIRNNILLLKTKKTFVLLFTGGGQVHLVLGLPVVEPKSTRDGWPGICSQNDRVTGYSQWVPWPESYRPAWPRWPDGESYWITWELRENLSSSWLFLFKNLVCSTVMWWERGRESDECGGASYYVQGSKLALFLFFHNIIIINWRSKLAISLLFFSFYFILGSPPVHHHPFLIIHSSNISTPHFI